jgi:uncharacterized NAD-dependent epimerase/dehydratase family protein
LPTVGTDCSIGKMFTALALARDAPGGLNADFRATGQTGPSPGRRVDDAVVSDLFPARSNGLARPMIQTIGT